MKTCVGKPLGPSLHTKDPWDFAGDTGSNAYFGTVERMKLGQFWGWQNGHPPEMGKLMEKKSSTPKWAQG